jgi:hypothetical protein
MKHMSTHWEAWKNRRIGLFVWSILKVMSNYANLKSSTYIDCRQFMLKSEDIEKKTAPSINNEPSSRVLKPQNYVPQSTR